MPIQIPSGNATLLTEQVASVLIQPLEQASTFLAAGPTIYNSASPLRIPRVGSGASAGFVAAGAQIPDSNATFDEVELLPSDLKGVKVLTKLSNELIRQSVVGLEAALRTRLVTDVANVLDAALWDGTGASNTIKGIFRQTSIATGTLDLWDPDTLIDAIATAQGNHVNPTHWVMTPESFAKIRKVKVGTGDRRYVIDPQTIANGTELRLLGLPVIITSNIPNTGTAPGKARVALVDFSHVAVARDVDADVTILDQTWGDYDTVGIRVVTRFDVALTQPEAVTLLTEA